LPVEDSAGKVKEKETNEIKTAIPLLKTIDIKGRNITADALLTQRSIAEYIVGERAHYHFIVKENQPTLHEDIALFFKDRQEPDFTDCSPPDHGRIEIRRIWVVGDELCWYLNFPYVNQAFVIERETTNKKTGKVSKDIAYGITSCAPEQADPERLLCINRKHWTIENSCHYIIDWNYNEDRSRIKVKYGPENMTRLRRFAVGLIKFKGVRSVAQKMRQLMLNIRMVFDYLRMTKNSRPRSCPA